MANIRLKFLRTDIKAVRDSYRKEVNKVINFEVNSAIAELIQETPVGVDGLLANSWKAIAARRQTVTFDIEYKIDNNDPLAFEKLFGRQAGRFPPVQPLERWVAAVINPTEDKDIRPIAFLVQRKIGRKGTDRSNLPAVLGIRRDLTYLPGSIIDRMQQRIESNLSRINVK